MEIYVLRHGIAVERGTPGYKKDSDRPLTKEGEEKVEQIAQAMLAMDLKFDLILSSPYVRAAKTAKIVASELDQEVTFTEFLEPDGNGLALTTLINDEKPQRVLLVGHEPNFSELTSRLLTGKERMAINFKKAGLCKLTAEPVASGRATLEWFLTPKLMELMG